MLKTALSAMLIMFVVIILYYVTAPVWNNYGNSLSSTAQNMLSGSYLTSFQNFMVSMNTFFGWGFIILAVLIVAYIFVYAWRVENDSGEI